MKGILEVNFKPRRVNRCLVLGLSTLEKPRFQPRPAEGPGMGRKCTGVRFGQAVGPSSLGHREKQIFRVGGCLERKLFCPPSVISIHSPPN